MAKRKPMRVEIECDLHGLTRREAWDELKGIASLLRKRGGGRARIIHGCGEVLSEMIFEFAEQAPDIEIIPEEHNPGASILRLTYSKPCLWVWDHQAK